MEIETLDVLEIVMKNAKEVLRTNHEKLMGSLPAFEALEQGHSLTPIGRDFLILVMELWDEERLWFTSNGRGGISLENVCDAAGTTVGIVRAFYQDLLTVPFNFKMAYSSLVWENNLAREVCGRCASERCQATQTLVHDEGGADRQGLAGSDRIREAGSDSVHRTEAPGHRPERS